WRRVRRGKGRCSCRSREIRCCPSSSAKRSCLPT
ncbi:MAG: hypothetical protein AVDCRST_MAG64-3727, partial [uncultured Phycisphaerae bacterium]